MPCRHSARSSPARAASASAWSSPDEMRRRRDRPRLHARGWCAPGTSSVRTISAAIGRGAPGAAYRSRWRGRSSRRDRAETKNVRRDFGDFLDGRAAGHAERVRNRPSARRAPDPVGAGPDDRRTAHRRHPDRRGVAAAEQLDLARRQRRHHAIARHHFDGIERRPVAPDPESSLPEPPSEYSKAKCGSRRRAPRRR